MSLTQLHCKWKSKLGRLNMFWFSDSAGRIWLDMASIFNQIFLLERCAQLYRTSPLLGYSVFRIDMITQYVYISVLKIGVNHSKLQYCLSWMGMEVWSSKWTLGELCQQFVICLKIQNFLAGLEWIWTIRKISAFHYANNNSCDNNMILMFAVLLYEKVVFPPHPPHFLSE